MPWAMAVMANQFLAACRASEGQHSAHVRTWLASQHDAHVRTWEEWPHMRRLEAFKAAYERGDFARWRMADLLGATLEAM